MRRSHRIRMRVRAKARLCGYSRFRHKGCRRLSCSCGLRRRAARAKVARPSRRLQSALLFRKPARPPRKIPPTSNRTAAPGPSCSTLRQPRRRVCLRSYGCQRSAVTLRTAPSPLRAAPSAVFPRAPQAPYQGLAPQGDEMNEKNIHPCRSNSAFVHSSEKMLITSRRFARSVAPCIKAFHAEKNARTATPSARRPSSRISPRRCCGRCRRGCRPATSRRGLGRTP